MSKDNGRFSTVIRKELRAAFFEEDRGGTLVNDLLSEYYETTKSEAQTKSKTPLGIPVFSKVPVTIENNGVVTTYNLPKKKFNLQTALKEQGLLYDPAFAEPKSGKAYSEDIGDYVWYKVINDELVIL